jgi:hypothetical protein
MFASSDTRVGGVVSASSLSLWDTNVDDVVSSLSLTDSVGDGFTSLAGEGSAVSDLSDVTQFLAFVVGNVPTVVLGFKSVLVDTVFLADVSGFLVANLDGSLLTDGLFCSSTGRFPVSTDGSSVSSEVVVLADVLEVLVFSGDNLLHLSTFGVGVDSTEVLLVVDARLVVVSLAFVSALFVVDFVVDLLAFS